MITEYCREKTLCRHRSSDAVRCDSSRRALKSVVGLSLLVCKRVAANPSVVGAEVSHLSRFLARRNQSEGAGDHG
jgi:hypothetical protein